MIQIDEQKKLILPSQEAMYAAPDIVMWKNADLKYLGASKPMISLFGFNKFEDVLGLSVYEIRCKAVESADQFMYQDKLVLSKGVSINILDIHPFIDNRVKILLGSRTPLYNNEDEIIGTVYRGTEIEKSLLENLIAFLMNSEKYYRNINQHSYSNTLDLNNNLLTNRERECLFYILHGFTAKHIAHKMKISPRTVETFILSLKNKFKCHTKNQLIERAIDEGHLSYLPSNIFETSISLILNRKID